MLKRNRGWVVGCGLWVVLSSSIYAQEPASSKELIENAKALDGKTVTYKGEAVTAIMNRGEYSWVNLKDGDNAIGAWCESAQLESVKFLGDYRNRGDILEVEGIFNRACPIHNGEFDIQAVRVSIVKSGFRTEEDVDRNKLKLSIALFLATLAFMVLFKRRFI